jgi:type IX secretion system substrate protein
MKSICAILICCCLLPGINLSAQGLATVQLTHFKTESRNGDVGLSWQTTAETDLRQFEIEYSRDGKYYENLGFIPARNHPNGNFYEFEHSVTYNDSAFYRLKIVDEAGGWLYTEPVLYYVNKISAFFVYPSVINTSAMNIYLQEPFYSLEVVNLNGAVMLKQNLDGKTGRISVPISPLLSSGIYIVQLKNNYKTITQKVIIQQ